MSSDHEQQSKRTERIFWTFSETHSILSVSKYGLRKLMDEGLPSHKIGKKRVFLKEDLIKWIKEHYRLIDQASFIGLLSGYR